MSRLLDFQSTSHSALRPARRTVCPNAHLSHDEHLPRTVNLLHFISNSRGPTPVSLTHLFVIACVIIWWKETTMEWIEGAVDAFVMSDENFANSGETSDGGRVSQRFNSFLKWFMLCKPELIGSWITFDLDILRSWIRNYLKKDTSCVLPVAGNTRTQRSRSQWENQWCDQMCFINRRRDDPGNHRRTYVREISNG